MLGLVGSGLWSGKTSMMVRQLGEQYNCLRCYALPVLPWVQSGWGLASDEPRSSRGGYGRGLDTLGSHSKDGQIHDRAPGTSTLL